MKKKDWKLRKPNCILYRKGGKNALKMFGYWDGDSYLEIYKTSDDSEVSTITLRMNEDAYIYWYESRRNKPKPEGYRLVLTEDVYCPKTEKIVLKKGEEFRGFEARYCGVDEVVYE